MKLERRVAERLLAEAVQISGPQRVVMTSLGWGDLTAALVSNAPEASFDCQFWDAFAATQASARFAHQPAVSCHCEPDLPPGVFDIAVLPTRYDGDSEFTRELVLQAIDRLRVGGVLWMATDNPKDHWLRDELRRWSKHVSIMQRDEGVVYRMTRPDPPPRTRSFEAEVVFRDGERLITLRTSPGVFAHRKIDPGARSLLETMEIRAGDRVLDIGCGSGAVGVAAALREPGVHLTALDAHPRAVAATRSACELNQVGDWRVLLEAEGRVPDPGSFDVALANPPYYSHHRISAVMVEAGLTALKPGGRLYVVTKDPDWYVEYLTDRVSSLKVLPVRRYDVISAEV